MSGISGCFFVEKRSKHNAPFFTILLVVSRKRVSFGDILWNTTFWILDLPLLQACPHASVSPVCPRDETVRISISVATHLRKPINRMRGWPALLSLCATTGPCADTEPYLVAPRQCSTSVTFILLEIKKSQVEVHHPRSALKELA